VIHKLYKIPLKVNDVQKGITLVEYTWFPYQNSSRCTEVSDVTLLDSWDISAEGHFTTNTDLFPRKISNSLNGCPMKVFIRNGNWYFTTVYQRYNDSNGNIRTDIKGIEISILKVVLRQMNMSFSNVPLAESLEIEVNSVDIIGSMLSKKVYVALGGLGTHYLSESQFDSTSTYFMMRFRWYVPCSIKYPRWSSIFRILSVELWLVLIVSIVIAAVSSTLLGRYSYTLEWQNYNSLSSSLTNFWAVILGVSVSTMPRASSIRSLFLAWVVFSLAFSTVFQAFLTTFLIDSGYKTPIQNLDEMFASGIKLLYPTGFNYFVDNGDETNAAKLKSNRLVCPSNVNCGAWALYHKNISILIPDMMAEEYYAKGDFVGDNSKPLVCRLEDGVFLNTGLAMIMFHGDPLMGRVNKIIDRVVEAGLYNYFISYRLNLIKLSFKKIAIVTRLMNITASTCITCNLHSISY